MDLLNVWQRCWLSHGIPIGFRPHVIKVPMYSHQYSHERNEVRYVNHSCMLAILISHLLFYLNILIPSLGPSLSYRYVGVHSKESLVRPLSLYWMSLTYGTQKTGGHDIYIEPWHCVGYCLMSYNYSINDSV